MRFEPKPDVVRKTTPHIDTTVPAKTGPLYRLRKAKWCVYFGDVAPYFSLKG